jgi:maleate isomerase
MRLNKDNWGSHARIGMFIVASEAVPEAEWWAMLPADVSVHAARITAATPWARWDENRREVELADDLSRGLQQFAAMHLSVVVVGHSSSSFLGGKGWDEAISRKLSATLKPTVSVTTNGLDLLAGLRALKSERPFLVLPAWFNEKTVDASLRYFTDHNVNPARHHRYDPGPKWRDVAPNEMYPLGAGFDQDVELLYAQIIEACPDTADSVLIAGTGFRCIAILDSLEKALGLPVVSANQASLWHSLKLAGVPHDITGYGRLFAI